MVLYIKHILELIIFCKKTNNLDLKNLVISHDDRQKLHGVLVTIIKYEKKNTCKILD